MSDLTKIIRETVAKKMQVINDAKDVIRDLQKACSHENATFVNKGSTGNYDPSADAYWREHYCPDCGKQWFTDK